MIRTTVRLPDELLAAAQQRAREAGQSFTEFLTDSLRYALKNPAEAKRVAEPLPVYGGSGVQPGVDLSNASALEEVMNRR